MNQKNTIGTAVMSWHGETFGPDHGPARMSRAKLKRCRYPVETLLIEATHELRKKLQDRDQSPSPSQLALLAVIFSMLKNLDGKNPAIAEQFGKKPLSQLRFQSLIRSHSHDDLIIPLKHSINVLGKDMACNGFQLASDLYYWNEKVRNNWCFQYFGATPPTTMEILP